VVTNGEPLWLYRTCGIDDASQERYAKALVAAGYDVRSTVVEYSPPLIVEASGRRSPRTARCGNASGSGC
jgi:hypothetical protein